MGQIFHGELARASLLSFHQTGGTPFFLAVPGGVIYLTSMEQMLWLGFSAVVVIGVSGIVIMLIGFRQNAAADRVIAERISMQMAESSGLMKEMARKTDEIAQSNKDNGLFLRMIFERIDKNR